VFLTGKAGVQADDAKRLLECAAKAKKSRPDAPKHPGGSASLPLSGG